MIEFAVICICGLWMLGSCIWESVNKLLKPFLLSLLIILANVLTLASTLILFPILVPIYMIKGDRFFATVKTKPEWSFLVYWTFNSTVLFCYCLLCPVWFLPKKLYDYCKNASDTKTDRSSVNTVTRMYECAICYEEMNQNGRHKVTFNPCGHSCCNECALRIDTCHLCRSDILDRITDDKSVPKFSFNEFTDFITGIKKFIK